MTVTAELEPARAAAAPGASSHLVLHVHNDGATPAACTLRADTELGDTVTLDADAVLVRPGETMHVPVTAAVAATTPPGPHTVAITVETPTADGAHVAPADDVTATSASATTTVAVAPALVTATATIDVEELADHRVALRPERSRSSARGRHQLAVDNRGNVAVHVSVEAELIDGDAVVEPVSTMTTVEPGTSAVIPIVVTPRTRFGRGPAHVHRFRVGTAGSDGKDDELSGLYEQLPRLQRWHVIAAASVLGALLLAALVWFALVRPAVRDIARDEADDALAEQQAAIDERIAELERSAAEAEELPLGTPTDLRLAVEVDAGAEDDDVATVPNGTVLSITDVVLQNPTGAVGTVALLRDGEVVLESELANFRDLDLHFVAPFRFEPGSAIALRVTCEQPGPAADACVVGATLSGFEDESG